MSAPSIASDMPDTALHGKVALVTGASKGLGKAIAAALARAGAEVVLVARNLRLLEDAAREIQSRGGRARCQAADVADETQVLDLARSFRLHSPRLDILVNNAGINIRKSIADFTLDEWNRVLATNLTGPFLMCRSFVPLMKGGGFGRILNLTSMMSHVALPERTLYATTKAGLLGFTRALALELAPDRITVNGISPGPCATEINRPILENPELTRSFLSRIPLARWGDPDEVAALALFLCSEKAGFITGTDIVIDGGWCAQ